MVTPTPGVKASQAAGTEAAGQPKWAVVVVHGVGETLPGATVDAFLPALAAINPDVQLSGVPEVRWLQELLPGEAPNLRADPEGGEPRSAAPFDEPAFLTLFPSHIRRVRNRQGDAGVVAEVFWADLSRVREGLLQLLWGVFFTIFGLRDVADQAAAQRGVASRWLRALAYAVAWVLRGPIAALNFLLLILLMVRLLMSFLVQSSGEKMPDARVMTVVGLLAAIGGSLMWCKLRRRSPAWATFWGSVALVGLWSVGVVGAILAAPEYASAQALDGWIRKAPYFKAGVALSDAQWCLALVLQPLSYAWGLETLLVLAMGVAWMAACLEAGYSGHREVLPAVTAAYSAAILQVVLWVLIVPMLALVGMRSAFRDQATINQFVNLWKVLGAQYLLAALLAGVGMLVWAHRLLLAYWGPGRKWLGDRPVPRLLVSGWIQATLIGILVLGCVVWVIGRILDPHLTLLEAFPGQELVALLAAAFVFLVPALPASGLRAGLHIVADIINHFHRVPEPFPWPWGHSPESEEAFTIRQRIEARFRSVLVEVLKSEDLTHLAIVAHSQGTLVALDVLRQAETANRLQHLREVTLLTMGSPFTHLYQHYFPRQYPSLREGHWDGLRARVTRWVNLFRIDDFVGTHVNGVGDSWPQNHRLPPGGHTNYWRQREVLLAFSELLYKSAAGDE